MTSWQRELERRTWANKHRRQSKGKRCFDHITRADDGGRQDITRLFGMVEMGVLFAFHDRYKRGLINECSRNKWDLPTL